ncbi:MAG: thioredoxin family protein [Flavobacteriales bacterium AspAUS03]
MKALISLWVSLLLFLSLTAQDMVRWVDLPTAEYLVERSPKKKIMIMFYTTWCGYCKLMNRNTFRNPAVVKYIDENYIPVRVDGETEDVIIYRKKRYPYLNSFRVNGLAYSLLNGRPSFPSIVIVDKNWNTVNLLQGYLSAPDFLKFLQTSSF